MKVKLFDFQETALSELQSRLKQARSFASIEQPQAVSFSAPTGSGKTIVMTALFETILLGSLDMPPQSDAVILWISDMPELNEQTRLKIGSKSDRIRAGQLIPIDSDFDAEKLTGGHIYFINTQKLGSDKRLTRTGDSRQYPIWETLTNTARVIPDRFYVVIDEAHRGMRSGKSADRAQAKTILQKFLLGSSDDGLCRMPLVIGVSATPRRFEDLLAGTSHTVHKVHVDAEEVRMSGLLKQRILIHYPESDSQAEMSLLSEAVRRWQIMGSQWAEYCAEEGDTLVRPILVVQVEDGTGKTLTKTDLGKALSTLDEIIGRRLREGEVAHTFHNAGELKINDRRVRYVEASRIEEDPEISVVLFKMSLSTGWDCPRAEVMMSFRSAQDHTYIAQLLGRMVRAPLARQIERDAALNDVHLYLPHYDRSAVENIVADLKDVEDVPPALTGSSRELVTLQRRSGTEDVFEAMGQLVTYRVNAVRKQSALRRLMGLARALTHDALHATAQTDVTQQLVDMMAAEVHRLREAGEFEQRARQITGVALETVALSGTNITEENIYDRIDTVSADIDRHFSQAGTRLGNGLEIAYWKAQADRSADEVKIEVVIIASDMKAMQTLEDYAENRFDLLYENHRRDVAGLTEKRRSHYEKLRIAAAQPKDIPWILPESIASTRNPNAPLFDHHLYVEGDGTYRVELGTWERDVLQEEMQHPDFLAWLRNQDRKSWSLEIPYEVGGTARSMFPDLLIVRRDTKGFLFDILEPHDPSRDDNFSKAVGLAKFAEKHWRAFDRIQLIRKQRGPDGKDHFYRLDMGNRSVRVKVLQVTSNQMLDSVFGEVAKVMVTG